MTTFEFMLTLISVISALALGPLGADRSRNRVRRARELAHAGGERFELKRRRGPDA
jgi:hypothetical protein